MWRGPFISFENGEGGPHNTYRPVGSLYVGGRGLGGPFPGRATHTHKINTQVLGSLHGSLRTNLTIVFALGLADQKNIIQAMIKELIC